MSDLLMMMLSGSFMGAAFLTPENPWPGLVRGICALLAVYLLIWAST